MTDEAADTHTTNLSSVAEGRSTNIIFSCQQAHTTNTSPPQPNYLWVIQQLKKEHTHIHTYIHTHTHTHTQSARNGDSLSCQFLVWEL